MSDNIVDFAQAKKKAGDYIVRGTAANGMVRAMAITARGTVQTARDSHNTSPVVTAALGRLMMAAQMIGVTFKDADELLTLKVDGDGPMGGLTVTADNAGHVKGYANHPNVWLDLNDHGKLDVGGAIGQGTLTVVRDIPFLEPYVSRINLVSGEIGDDISSYYAQSEQIPTAVGVGVLVDTDTSVKCAGGFFIQLMPGYDDSLVDELEAALSGIDSVTNMLEAGKTPEDILEEVLGGMGYHTNDVIPACFKCDCSYERVSATIASLGAQEIQSMIDEGKPAEVSCHFCGKRYEVTVDELKALLDEAQA